MIKNKEQMGKYELGEWRLNVSIWLGITGMLLLITIYIL